MNKALAPGGPEPMREPQWAQRYLPGELEPAADASENLIDFAFIRGALYRQRLLIVAVVAFALVAGLVITLLSTPVYQASATVKVTPNSNQIVEGQDISTPYLSSNEVYPYLQTQQKIIESRKLALAVADALKIDERPEILGLSAPAGPQGKVAIRNAAASILKSSVSTEIPDESRIIQINYQSEDPQLAARIANAYADAYVGYDLRENLEANRYAREYLEKQIVETRAKLRDAEFAANDYARKHRIVTQGGLGQSSDGSDGAGSAPTITGANLASINAAYAEAKARRIAAEQRWRAIANTSPLELEQVQNSSAIQTLQTARAQLARELADLRQRYDDSFPAVREKQAELAAIDTEIAQAGAQIKRALRKDYDIALQQERALEAEVNRQSSMTLEEQDRQVQYQLLDREAAALRGQLASLLERYNDIATAANVRSGTVSKLDSAQVPGAPISPNLFKNLMFALVGGLGLAGGLAVLRELIDDRLRSVTNAENKLGLPLLGQTPHVPKDQLESEIEDPFSGLMEAYTSIVSALDYSLPRRSNLLQITSSQASEGKTTSALLIARSFARLGRKVLLIDGDLRKPSLLKQLDVEKIGPGLAEVLLGHCTFEEAVRRDIADNLDVLAGTKSPPNPVQLLSSNLLEEFLDQRREEYGLIIIDSPPVLGIADAPVLARVVDATLFVAEANKVSASQARTAIRRLRAVGGDLVGMILTKYRALDAGEDYYYQYSYYSYAPGTGERRAIEAADQSA